MSDEPFWALGIEDTFEYLGIDFGPAGVVVSFIDIRKAMVRICEEMVEASS